MAISSEAPATVLLDLPEAFLIAVATAVGDWKDRKALRAACRALQHAADAVICGATLEISDIIAMPENAPCRGMNLLRRLKRLVIHDPGNEVDMARLAAALDRFGDASCLNQLTCLQSLSIAGMHTLPDRLFL